MTSQTSVPVESILATSALWSRAPSTPRWKEEAEAFRRLSRQLVRNPTGILQMLVEEAITLCNAGSAGVSLLEVQPDGTELFRWVALAGECMPFVGRSTPRDFSPCGICLQQNQPVLVSYPARLFTYFAEIPCVMVEGLILPLATDEEVFGTIWIVSHDEQHRFDAEDVRVMKGLADFTAAALHLQRVNEKLSKAESKRESLVHELERSNSELSRFSHMVAHDLKTHIRTIRSFAELLTRKHQGDGDDDLRTAVTVAAGSMHNLVESLLAYAEVGKGSLHTSSFSIAEMLDEIEAAMRAELDEAGAEIRRGPLPDIEADRNQIQRLFQNLIGNGIKYRRSDVRAVITISGESIENGWKFSIQDNGIGIEPQYIASIFQPFRRLHGCDIPGTGLGLAMCSSIVDRHHGRISVESEPGKGSTFSFTLRQPASSALTDIRQRTAAENTYPLIRSEAAPGDASQHIYPTRQPRQPQ